jgi:hypothetical protein
VRFRTGNWSQGGSTITQQLARNIFLNNTRTFNRKMREAILAMALEWRFSKEQILELYLNRVYFGGGAYGIDAASRRFFGHGATQLSVEEAAIIAGLVKAPSNYSPTADIEAARGRAGVVLRQMQEQEYITAAQAAAADPNAVPLADGPEPRTATRYFTDWILPQLDTLLDQKVTDPIEVWTTIDVGLQGQATAPSPPMSRTARRELWCRWIATGRCGRWSAGSTTSRPITTARRRPIASRDRRGSCSSTWPRWRLATRRTPMSTPARSPSRAGARADRPPARCRCARPSRCRSTPPRCASPRKSASARSGTWRGGSASRRPWRAIRPWRSARPR